jgi:hypothetical protein
MVIAVAAGGEPTFELIQHREFVAHRSSFIVTASAASGSATRHGVTRWSRMVPVRLPAEV